MTPRSQPRVGYTLPVFACAAAIAALDWLQTQQAVASVSVDLLDPAEIVDIPVEQVAGLDAGQALAVTRSDPGDNLDLTRDTPVWALVAWGDPAQTDPIALLGGEGIGQHVGNQKPAIYRYARQLLLTNLERSLPPDRKLRVTLILPEGRRLAERTSNAAFGVVEGLSLLGTGGLSHPLSAPDQLAQFRAELQAKAAAAPNLVFCVGENGLALAQQQGIPATRLVKTANWLGPLLVEAGLQGVTGILLLGYHGKLLKLAGGIFHTHHHVADARQEILTAYGVAAGLPLEALQVLRTCAKAEDGLRYLRQQAAATDEDWVGAVYGAIAQAIDTRAQQYIQTHSGRSVTVGTQLFDRQRQIFIRSAAGVALHEQVLLG